MEPSPPQAPKDDPLPRHMRGLLVLLTVCWLAFLAGDWFLRFYWFRWDMALITRPSKASNQGPGAPMRRVELPPSRGGDLTRLIGLAAAARPYEVERPASLDVTDEFGFRNVPPTTNVSYEVVVLGDSFMAHGLHVEETFGGQLARATGRSIYNYAYPGRGPVYPVSRFFEEGRFRARPPRVLVWGLVEREIGGDVLAALPWYLEQGVSQVGAQRTHINITALYPSYLKQALPNTSAAAQAARRFWNVARYRLFGRITPDLAIAARPVAGRSLLFYTPAVRAMRWTKKERDPVHMAEVLAEVSRYCGRQGLALVVVLIPDKEQVYRDLLPDLLTHGLPPLPPSTFDELEIEAHKQGVHVVNLLPAFRSAAQRDALIFWPDDTHWNGEGVRIGAGETARVLAKVFDSFKGGADNESE